MNREFFLYDTHAHLGTALHSGRTCTEDEMLRHMDRHGVDRALLIPFPVVADYKAQHDLIAHAVREYSDYFAGACCLDPFIERSEFNDEVRRCVEELGFRAMKLQPQYQALNPLSPRSDFFFEAAMRHGLAVVVHTGSGAPFALPSLYVAKARKFPDLPIVLAHAGGSSYFLEAILAAGLCSNIYVELSSLMPHHVKEVLAHVPADRLMIGSDLPESIGTEFGKILGLDEPDTVKRMILSGTARRVFDGAAE